MSIPIGAAVQHLITGRMGRIVRGPRRASRGMLWVSWDGIAGGADSAPLLTSRRVLIYLARRHATAKQWVEHNSKGAV
jgi:hypothetical protein